LFMAEYKDPRWRDTGWVLKRRAVPSSKPCALGVTAWLPGDITFLWYTVRHLLWHYIWPPTSHLGLQLICDSWLLFLQFLLYGIMLKLWEGFAFILLWVLLHHLWVCSITLCDLLCAISPVILLGRLQPPGCRMDGGGELHQIVGIIFTNPLHSICEIPLGGTQRRWRMRPRLGWWGPIPTSVKSSSELPALWIGSVWKTLYEVFYGL
jgi:hypothetical protein